MKTKKKYNDPNRFAEQHSEYCRKLAPDDLDLINAFMPMIWPDRLNNYFEDPKRGIKGRLKRESDLQKDKK